MSNSQELIKRDPEDRYFESPGETFAPPAPYADYVVDRAGAAESGKNLHDYLRAVRKYLWLIILITTLSTLLGAVYMARKPDVYGAEARIQVDLENNPARGISTNGSVVIDSPINDPDYFNTQLQILTGTGLLRRVVKTLDLERDENFFRPQSVRNRSIWQSLGRMIGFNGEEKRNGKSDRPEDMLLTTKVAPATSREDLQEAKRLAPYVEALQAGLEVEQLGNTRLIGIQFKHLDPHIAARVVNAIADTFVLSNLERMTESNTNAGGFLQQRIAELQAQIRSGEHQLINYAKSNQILSLDAGQNTVVDRLAGINRQLMEAENERKLAEAAYQATSAPGAADALAETSSAQIAAAEARIGDLRQRRAQLLIDNTEEWPEVKEITQQITMLEKQIQDTRNHAKSLVLTNLETRYRQAYRREQLLREAFNKQRGETLTQNEAAINYRIIQQEIQTNKTLLDGLLQRYKENDVVLARTPNNVHVTDYAIEPGEPVGPRRMQAVMLAFAGSLGLSIGFAIFLGYLDRSVVSVDEVEKVLRLPALAVIPTIKSFPQTRLLSNGKMPSRNGSYYPLLVNDDWRSPTAEVYRKLRTTMLLSTEGRAPRTYLVTSSLPSEGKTTTAVNIALSLAQTNAKVLIIDADMRHPCVHSIFGLRNDRGLSNILAGEMAEAEMLMMIEQHAESDLYVLSAGKTTESPAELLGSEQMRRLLAILKSTFTHIVVDSPPITPFADGLLISSMVDGVLLVVHSGKSSQEAVISARKELEDVGANIFGVVLNNVNKRPHDSYYYYYQAPR